MCMQLKHTDKTATPPLLVLVWPSCNTLHHHPATPTHPVRALPGDLRCCSAGACFCAQHTPLLYCPKCRTPLHVPVASSVCAVEPADTKWVCISSRCFLDPSHNRTGSNTQRNGCATGSCMHTRIGLQVALQRQSHQSLIGKILTKSELWQQQPVMCEVSLW